MKYLYIGFNKWSEIFLEFVEWNYNIFNLWRIKFV